MSLAECVDRATASIWPRRTQQELLFDLGERKRWSSRDRQTAIRAAAQWFTEELNLPPSLMPAPTPSGKGDGAEEEQVLSLARSLGPVLDLGERRPGVAAWASGISPALGSSPKTLANSVARPLRADRSDHRWLRVIARASRGESKPDAWCFHRRSRKTLSTALTSLASTMRFDSGHALVVLSLLALWQRRRPTDRVKGNRGKLRSRRVTPKPVADLLGGLAHPAQAPALVKLARQLTPEAGRAISELAIEAALTEAHLAPHPARSSASRLPPGTSDESWLSAAEAALRDVDSLVTDEDRAVFAFRVERQRAWRAQRPQPVADEQVQHHPYVDACLALEQTIINPKTEIMPFASETPGTRLSLRNAELRV